jgi:hypothetical protein
LAAKEKPMTKTKQRIVEAYQRGYRVTPDGKIFGPKGELKVSKSPKQRYPTFGTNWGGCVYGIPVHQFAAYCFYGDDYLLSGKVVRHLDANTLNFSQANIALGTGSDNEHDKPASVRQNSARLARAAQGFTPINAKLNENQVREVRQIYAEASGKKLPNGACQALVSRLGVSRTVLHKIKNGEYYPNVR